MELLLSFVNVSVSYNCYFLVVIFSADFSQAIRKNTNLTLGLYHSLYEWFHPLYVKDVANNFRSQDYVKV